MTAAERRAVRGLLKRLRAGKYRKSGRMLVNTVHARERGVCCWCCQQTAPRVGWHPECVVAYCAARGETVTVAGTRLLAPAYCDECAAPGIEIDHRVSLGVAHLLRETGDRRWWRAWTIPNLRWLCHACHVTKTRADGIERKALQTGQPRLFG